MKRITALLLSAALAFGLLCACSGPDAQATVQVLPTDPAEATQPAETPSPAPTETPSPSPSAEPSAAPSEGPSTAPSAEPSQAPASAAPAPTPAPTPAPAQTSDPSPAPSDGVDLLAFLESIASDDEEFAANMAVTEEMLDGAYPGLSAIATKQRVVYQPRMSAVVCEIALVEVSSSADVDAVKEIFQQRIDYMVGDGVNQPGAWYPSSIESWQRDSRIVSHGDFVMMIAYGKCDSIVSAFNALF